MTTKHAGLALLLLAATPALATADPIIYRWGSLEGYGFVAVGGTGFTPFQASSVSATLIIGYDPNDLARSYLEIDAPGVGGAGGPVLFPTAQFTLGVGDDGVSFGYSNGSVTPGGTRVSATITGDPGPLNASGLPLSLDSLRGGSVTASGSSKVGESGEATTTFISVQSVPEPSGLVLGSLGLASCVVWARRRARRAGR